MLYFSIGTIKNLVAREMDTEELAFVSASLNAVAKEYTAIPEWFSAKQKELSRELTERSRADKEKNLRVLKARRESLKTPDEKRLALDAQITALEKELG